MPCLAGVGCLDAGPIVEDRQPARRRDKREVVGSATRLYKVFPRGSSICRTEDVTVALPTGGEDQQGAAESLDRSGPEPGAALCDETRRLGECRSVPRASAVRGAVD